MSSVNPPLTGHFFRRGLGEPVGGRAIFCGALSLPVPLDGRLTGQLRL